MNYTPQNWYWLADDGRLYSSLEKQTISPENPIFLEWKQSGGIPTRWPVDENNVQTDAPLADVLAAHGLAMTAAHAKTMLKMQIDAAAETVRLKYITAGTGQAMTYQRKVDEAKQAIAETNPKPADYPLLSASIGIDGANLKAVAAVILGMDAAWAQIGAQIERIRLTAKQDIDATEDEAAARSVIAAIVWPSAQQG